MLCDKMQTFAICELAGAFKKDIHIFCIFCFFVNFHVLALNMIISESTI